MCDNCHCDSVALTQVSWYGGSAYLKMSHVYNAWQSEWHSRGSGDVFFIPFTAQCLAHWFMGKSKIKHNNREIALAHKIPWSLSDVDKITAFKAADEHTDNTPIPSILKGTVVVIYEDEVQKLMKSVNA